MTRAAGRKTGPTPAGVIARLKAQMIARYGLANVPGRAEELRQPGTTLGVSVQYGCQQIRIRLMDDRKWVSVFDLQVAAPDQQVRQRVFTVLDAWFSQIEKTEGSKPLAGWGGGHSRVPSGPVQIHIDATSSPRVQAELLHSIRGRRGGVA